MSILGVMIGAVSVAIFKMAAFGVDPFQSFMSGISELIPISFGTLYVIVNAVLLAFSLIFDRHYIGIATFINLFLLGYVTEFSYKLFSWLIPEPSLPLRALLLVVGIVIICIGSSLYITADLGVSTYDAVALKMANKWKIGKFKFIRVLCRTGNSHVHGSRRPAFSSSDYCRYRHDNHRILYGTADRIFLRAFCP